MKAYQSTMGWVAMVLVGASAAYAGESRTNAEMAKFFADDEKYLTVGSVVVESDDGKAVEYFNDKKPRRGRVTPGGPGPIVEGEPKTEKKKDAPKDSGSEPASDPFSGTGLVEIDQIVNLGLKVWDLVVKNKPVVNVATASASAVPRGVEHWAQLAGWQAPKSRIFRIRWKNLYGMDVVDFSFRLLYTYGGNVQGKGAYLANVTMVPASLTVSWGYTFNAEASVPSVTNAGTENNPIGAAELLSKWSVDTVLKHDEGSMSFYVKGNGEFLDLTNGNQ